MQGISYFCLKTIALVIEYTPASQLTIEGFDSPFEKELSKNNRWVKLASVIPWDSLAVEYGKQLNAHFGRKSVDIRMVIGAIIVKHKLGLSDRETVATISENIYLQYFCGLKSFQIDLPFDSSLFVSIRKRLGKSSFDEWNKRVIESADSMKPPKAKNITASGKNQDDTIHKNKGRLIVDATVADQEIVYPTDATLLNRARLESERLIDFLYKQSEKRKPRTYRRKARTEFLVFSKKRRKSGKQIRKFIGKQIRYIKRNLNHIELLLNEIAQKSDNFPLSPRDQKIYWVLQLIHAQQTEMYETKTKRVSNRVVNIYQPYVRPIVRGKDKVNVEFGAKINISLVDGMVRINTLSWEAYNESQMLIAQVEEYKEFYGHYPDLVLADQIYLTRRNRKWLKEKGIRISGKPLGRPKKEKQSAYEKRKQKKERNQRNLVEAKFGQGKKAYGLKNIQAKRKDTSESWINSIFFVMNLVTLMKVVEKYAFFYNYRKNRVLLNLFSKTWDIINCFLVRKTCDISKLY